MWVRAFMARGAVSGIYLRANHDNIRYKKRIIEIISSYYFLFDVFIDRRRLEIYIPGLCFFLSIHNFVRNEEADKSYCFESGKKRD